MAGWRWSIIVDKALSLIDQKLAQLATASPRRDQQQPTEFRIVLLVGMGGGTGGGMAIDLANATRSRLQASGRRGQVQGVFVCTCLGNTSASPLSVANTYALLTELQFVSAFGNQGIHGASGSLQQLESRDRPFDLVYCVKTVHHADQPDDGLCLIAQQMALASTDSVRQMLQCCQQTATPKELAHQGSLALRTFGSTAVAATEQQRIDRLAHCLARVIGQHWLGNASPSEWRQLDRTDNAQSSATSSEGQGNSADISPVVPATSATPAEAWRHRFGDHASTRFAYEVVSRICRHSNSQDIGCETSLSSTDPARFVERAAQALSAICKRVAESPQPDDLRSAEDQIIVDDLASGSDRMLTKLIDDVEQMSPDSPFDAAQTERILATECVAAVEECLGRRSTGETAAQQALERADVDLLQCGYDRRTFFVVPSSHPTGEAIDALTKARPTAALVAADVDESFVFCEGSGISPSSVLRGFERVYPGIAEAASRLFTRIDIDWSAQDVVTRPFRRSATPETDISKTVLLSDFPPSDSPRVPGPAQACPALADAERSSQSPKRVGPMRGWSPGVRLWSFTLIPK